MPAQQSIATPYDGVLMLAGAAVRCFVTKRGARYLSTKGVVRAITGEAMTTWAAFVRTVPGLDPVEAEALVVRVRPKRGDEVEAVPATLLPDLCLHYLEAVGYMTEPTAEQARVAQRCAAMTEEMVLQGMASIGRRAASMGGAS
jgi:hypothetical protein